MTSPTASASSSIDRRVLWLYLLLPFVFGCGPSVLNTTISGSVVQVPLIPSFPPALREPNPTFRVEANKMSSIPFTTEDFNSGRDTAGYSRSVANLLITAVPDQGTFEFRGTKVNPYASVPINTVFEFTPPQGSPSGSTTFKLKPKDIANQEGPEATVTISWPVPPPSSITLAQPADADIGTTSVVVRANFTLSADDLEAPLDIVVASVNPAPGDYTRYAYLGSSLVSPATVTFSKLYPNTLYRMKGFFKRSNGEKIASDFIDFTTKAETVTHSPPVGTSKPVPLNAGDTVALAPGDWGFNDNADLTKPELLKADDFVSVRFTSLPASGQLRVDGALAEVNKSYLVVDNALPGASWIPRGPSGSWTDIAASMNGMKLAAVVNSGQLYTSTDGGLNWQPRDTRTADDPADPPGPPDRNWISIAASGDGMMLVAAADGGKIYRSIDGGLKWEAAMTDANRAWRSIASSGDGQRLAAVVFGGEIFTSINGGQAWSRQSTAGTRNWSAVTSTADGQQLAAGVMGGGIWTSANYGGTWTEQTSAGKGNWTSLCYAGDGSKLVAVGLGTLISISNNQGATWRQIPFGVVADPHQWTSVACSADGKRIAATTFGGKIYFSDSNDGSWEERASDLAWTSVVVAGDGSRAAAVAHGGKIHVSGGPPLISYTAPAGAASTATLGFKVEDSGPTGQNVASAAATLTLNAAARVRNPSSLGPTTVNLRTGQTYTIKTEDWRFQDLGDTPPDTFVAVRIDGLLGAGALKVNGLDATVGQVVPVVDAMVPRASIGNWQAIASSSDGVKLAAVAQGGQLYLSTNSGADWTAQNTAQTGEVPNLDRNWQAIASSSDGSKLIAAVKLGKLYTSIDYGATWTARDSIRNWSAVASNSDGSKLAAVVNGGQIYVYTDSEDTWTATESNRAWSSITSNAAGDRLVATAYGGQIYTGRYVSNAWQWTAREQNRNWQAVASNGTGNILTAVVYGGKIYLSSDFGSSWVSLESDRNWSCIILDPAGTQITAGVLGGQLYQGKILELPHSPGGQLKARDVNRNWRSLASSADGSKLAAAVSGGPLYTTASAVPVITYTAPASGSGSATVSATLQDSGVADNLSLQPVTLKFNYKAPTPPEGKDVKLSVAPLSTTELTKETWGFFDSDTPSDKFTAVKLTTLPAPGTGTLQVDDVDATEGQVVQITPTTVIEFIAPAGSVTAPVGENTAVFTFQVQDNAPSNNEDPTPRTFTIKNKTAPTLAAVRGEPIIDGESWFQGSLISDGYEPVNSEGFVYALTSVNDNPQIDGTGVIRVEGFRDGGRDFFESVATSLDPTQAYSVRSYATNGVGTGYSAVASVTGAPTTTSTVIDVAPGTSTTVDTSSLGSTTAPGATVRAIKIMNVPGTGAGTLLVNGTPATEGQIVTILGQTVSFTAPAAGMATTSGMTEVYYQVQDSNGNFSGSSKMTFYYSYAPTGTDKNFDVAANSETTLTIDDFGFRDRIAPVNDFTGVDIVSLPTDGTLRVNNTELDTVPTTVTFPATIVFVAPDSSLPMSFQFKVRDNGVAPDNVAIEANTLTFQLPGAAPKVTARTVNAYVSYAVLSGIVTSNGNREITEGGLVVAPTLANGNPTLGGKDVLTVPCSVSRFVPAFGASALGLNEGTQYSYKAYAKNSEGTSYSLVETFTTTGATPAARKAPEGKDKNLAVQTGSVTTLNRSDWGFSDADTPPDLFTGVKITTLPAVGSLQKDGSTIINAGDIVSVKVPWAPSGPNLAWRSVASSKDGTRLAAVAYNDQIYLSQNSGVSWKPAEPTTRGYYFVTTNGDGSLIAAISYSPASKVIVSKNYGVTWAERDEVRDWACIASNEQGDKLVAVVYGGYIYTSTNYGDSWTPRAFSSQWHGVTSSASGDQLAAADNNGNIWTSTDAGLNWTSRESVRPWLSIASSADGMKLVAAGEGTQIYTSVNGGQDWTASESERHWRGITSSADGTRLAACHFGGQIYTSTDGGENWTAQPGSPNCRCIDSSADGQKLVAGSDGGQLYTFSGPTPVITYTAPSGTVSATFTFQVQDSGESNNLDELPNTITINYSSTAAPVLGVTTAKDVFINSANMLGNIASNGGAAITEQGFVYAPITRSPSPIIGGPGVVQKPSALVGQSLSASESGLQPGTTYALRSYARNSMGLSYSEVVNFRTPSLFGRLEIRTEDNSVLADDDLFGLGNVATGATKTRRLTVRNVGSVKLINIIAPITGANAANFTRTLPSSVLEPGASMKVDITFAPAAQGAATATIAFSSSDTSQPAQRVNLSGNGVAPGAAALSVKAGDTQLADNVGSVNYGNVPQGTTAERIFTLTNTGANNLTGLALSVIGTHKSDVTFSPLTTTELSAGDSVSFIAYLTPGGVGARTATIQIKSNDATAQPFFDIPVTATGIVPEIDVKQGTTAIVDNSTVVSFGTAVTVGTNSVRTFTVTNIGSSTLTLGAISFDGASAADFTATMPGSLSLASNASTTFDVTFRPSTGGPRTAALHLLTSDANESPFDIKLSGTGIGSEISVAAGTVQLVSNGPAIDFGEVITGSSSMPRSYTIKNIGNSPLNGISVSSDSTRFVVGGTPLATLNANASTTFTLTFSPDADGPFTGTISIASDDFDEGTFTIPVKGKGAPNTAPTIDPGPQDQIVELGQRVIFGATVTSPLSFTRQWRKVTAKFANIASAIAETYTIDAVKLSDAAVKYQLRATNIIGTKLYADSNAAELTVVDRTPSSQSVQITKSATFTISAATAPSSALTYVWKKVGGALPGNASFAGNKLTLTNVVLTNAGIYTCDVTGPGGTLTGGANELTVFDAPPQIATPAPAPSLAARATARAPITLTLPSASVGGDYTYQIPLAEPSHRNASSYACTPLPAGLMFDTKTGRLYGIPTKAGTYSMTLTATNALGSSTATGSLTVSPSLGNSVTGTYIGLIERGALSGGLGGRLDLTIANSTKTSTTRGLTGYILLGTVKTPFTGSLIVGDLSTSISVPRMGLPALTLAITLDSANNRFADTGCTITDGTNTSAFSGWRAVWSTTTAPTTYVGGYNFAASPPAGSPIANFPLGYSYGSVTVATAGTLTMAGKLADGDGYTCTGPLGPNGEVAVFTVLPSKGSLIGRTQINPGATNSANTLATGSLTWNRPATAITATTKTTTYAAGFGPIDLTCGGGRYVAPVAPGILMGKAAGASNAQLSFYDANIGGPPSPADCAVTLTTTAATAGTSTTLTRVTVTGSTGTLTGTFTLKDNHPFLSGAPIITRAVSFSGLIIPTASGQRGYGFFLLPQLPVNVYPAPPQSILSGAVELE